MGGSEAAGNLHLNNMGVPVEWRSFLWKWMTSRGRAQCFRPSLPHSGEGSRFDIVLVDAAQYVACIKYKPSCDTGYAVCQALWGALDHCLNAEPRPSLVIACLDNSYTVPRNKSIVERERDEAPQRRATEKTDDPLPRFSANQQVSYDAMVEEVKSSRGNYREGEHFLIDEGAFPAHGTQVWRSTILRWQLLRMLTNTVLSMNIPEGQRLLFDEGIALSKERYRTLHAEMLSQHGYDDGTHSDYDKAVLVSQLMRSCTQRVLVHPDHQFSCFPSTGVGESDNKLFYYVQRTPPMGMKRIARPNGELQPFSYLIRCQDTDVLYAALMHVSSLINPSTGNVDEVSVWLDTQTPGDASRGESLPYRFVNVVELWRCLHHEMAQEFPSLKCPLEALIVLVFCNANDYVEPFPSSLSISCGTLWNAFANAHASKADYPQFTNPEKRVKRLANFPKSLRGVFNDSILSYPRAPDEADGKEDAPLLRMTLVEVQYEAAMKFLYYVVQTSRGLVSAARRCNVDLAYTEDAGKLQQTLLELQTRLSQRAKSDAEEEMRRKGKTQPEAPLPLLGVPSQRLMMARIARINWTLSYYANGWKTGEFAHNWCLSEDDYSLHGWTIREVTGALAVMPDSGYLYADYVHPSSAHECGYYRYYSCARAEEVREPMY